MGEFSDLALIGAFKPIAPGVIAAAVRRSFTLRIITPLSPAWHILGSLMRFSGGTECIDLCSWADDLVRERVYFDHSTVLRQSDVIA